MEDKITDRTTTKVVVDSLEEGVDVVEPTTEEGAVVVDTTIGQTTTLEGDMRARAAGDIAIKFVLLPIFQKMMHHPALEGDSMIRRSKETTIPS